MSKVGLNEYALVPAARLRDLGERRAVGLGVLRAHAAREVRLPGRGYASGPEDPPGLLELRRVRELLLAVPPDEDLNSVLVLPAPEGRWGLARYVPPPEQELRQGPLCIEEGVLVAYGAHELLPRRLVHLPVLEEADEAAARGRALRGRVVQKGQVRELHLTAVLPPEEVVVAKEEVDARPQILWRLGRPAQQNILYAEPLLRRVASLNAVRATVLEGLPVKSAALAAALLEEAAHGRSTGVLGVAVSVRDL